MRRLVADVLLGPVAEEGVDHPLLAVGQEEGPALGEVGVMELEEVVERLAVVEEVDLDRVLAHLGLDPERLADLRLQALELADHRGLGVEPALVQTRNGPVRV